MAQKLLKGVAAVLLFVSFVFTASAKEVTIGKLRYKVNTTDKTAKCTGLAEEATKNYNLTIPSTVSYDGVTLKVISVEKDAFWWDLYLKKLTLGDNIETIGSFAFSSCQNLSVVSLGKKLKIIGKEAFSHAGLNDTFTSVTFPASLEIIRDDAFLDCRCLKSVTFSGEKITSIGNSAFWHCDALQTIVLPGSLQSIGESCFACCVSLEEVNFGYGTANTVIGEKCFDNLKKLKRVNFYGPGVAEIKDSAFIGCAIEWLYLPSSVKVVGGGAFAGNDLTILELSEGLERIGELAFEGQYSTGLYTLTIPSTVKFIGTKAFKGVGRPHTVVCKAVVPPTCEEDAMGYELPYYSRLEVPQASLAAYQKAFVWKDFEYINNVPSGIDGIQDDENQENAGAFAEEPEEWFDLSGRPVNKESAPAGIYLVRRNGRFEKIRK